LADTKEEGTKTEGRAKHGKEGIVGTKQTI